MTNKQPNLSSLKKYARALRKYRGKKMTAELLSSRINVYPEVITDCLSYFEPMLAMDTDYNLLELLPAIDKFIQENDETKDAVSPINKQPKIKEFDSIYDFVFKKMTVGGVLDKNLFLSDKDLNSLTKLIKSEQKRRKK